MLIEPYVPGKCKRLDTCICKPSFNFPYRFHYCDTSRLTPVRINSNTSGKMNFLLFPFLFPPFFSLSFSFFCFIFHFCGTVMAWINTMTGCFRLSGFSRRYFRRTRKLVNSLAAGTSTVYGDEGRKQGEEERAKCMCSKRVETSLQTVRSRLRHHCATTLALKPTHGLLFFSPYRAPLSPFGARVADDDEIGARRTRPCSTYACVHALYHICMPHRKWENEMNRE